MGDFFWKILEWLFTQRELALMENAPRAVWKIAGTVFIISGLLWRLGFFMLYQQQVAALQTIVDLRDAQVADLRDKLAARGSGTGAAAIETPSSLGKYVCTTTLPAESGKHALLVEFGVRRGQTNGFVGEVHFTTPYVKNDTWIGTPLRTERQRVVTMKIDHKTWETPDHLSYAERFMSPIITPRLSYYLYFEAEQPLQVKSLFFIEDPLALSDQLRTNTLAKEVEACPR